MVKKRKIPLRSPAKQSCTTSPDKDRGVVRLPELIRHLDHYILASEKRNIEESLLSLDQDYVDPNRREDRRTERMFVNLRRKVLDQDLSDKCLRTIIKAYQYHLNETNVLDEIDRDRENEDKAEEKLQNVPTVTLQTPIRPTALLDRVIDKYKMNRGIVIPTMVLKDTESSLGSSHKSATSSQQAETSVSADLKPRRQPLPHFYYANGEGMGERRNLPGQPDLIRLLNDPDLSLEGNNQQNINDSTNIFQSNSLFSLYGASASPPLIDKGKQKTRQKKRKIVCKFCRRPPGDHQKWCVYYDFRKICEDPEFDMERSHTADDIDLSDKREKDKMPEIERSKTTMEDYPVRTDLPDYRPLHRDVYIRALADSRARLLMQRAQDFMNQLTRPFVFSYFRRMKSPKHRKTGLDGMQSIFGKERTNFTEYYRIFANSKKLDDKTENK